MPIIYLVRRESVPVYVGFTSKSLEKRWYQHIRSANARHECMLLHRAIAKYGVDAFTIEEIYSSDDVDHTLNVMEPHFIREHHTHKDEGGYNISYGGMAGTIHTKETKQKISLGNRERYSLLTEEQKEKRRSEARERFLTLPEEIKNKMRNGRKGIPLTEEHREKIRSAAKKRKHTEETKKKIGMKSGSVWKGKKHTEQSKEKMRLAKRTKSQSTTRLDNPTDTRYNHRTGDTNA